MTALASTTKHAAVVVEAPPTGGLRGASLRLPTGDSSLPAAPSRSTRRPFVRSSVVTSLHRVPPASHPPRPSTDAAAVRRRRRSCCHILRLVLPAAASSCCAALAAGRTGRCGTKNGSEQRSGDELPAPGLGLPRCGEHNATECTLPTHPRALWFRPSLASEEPQKSV